MRKLRGGTQSHLVQCDDNHYYAVKSPLNPQGTRVLINEYLGSQVFRELDIATATVTPITMSQTFLDAHCDMGFALKTNRVPLQPGIHLGSRYEVCPDAVAIYDFLPEALLPKVNNALDFLGAFIADHWLCNYDTRQFVFYREPATDFTARRGYRAVAIDHGLCLGGQNWQLIDSPLTGGNLQSGIYRSSSSVQLDGWLQRLSQIDQEKLRAWAVEIPSEWMNEDGPELERFIGRLIKRKRRVPELVNAAIQANPSSFPKWYSPKTETYAASIPSLARSSTSNRRAHVRSVS